MDNNYISNLSEESKRIFEELKKHNPKLEEVEKGAYKAKHEQISGLKMLVRDGQMHRNLP